MEDAQANDAGEGGNGPHRSNGRGTFVLDRVFPGVGRLRRASGTTSVADFADLNRLLTKLWERRHQKLLVAVRDGDISPMDLLVHHEDKGFHGLVEWFKEKSGSSGHLEELEAVWTRWVNRKVVRKNTRRMYQTAWRRLSEVKPAGVPTWENLANRLVRFRSSMEDEGKAPTFNRVRASVLAFLKGNMSTTDPLYEKILGVRGLKEVPGTSITDGEADDEEETMEGRRGLTLAQARQIRRDLGGAAGEAWWTLVTTGMRPGELWREDGLEWVVEGARVRIYRRGKSRAARRVVTRLVQVVQPQLRLREFRDEFRSMQVRPYWARYTFKALMLEAGVPINRVEQYLGHSTKSLDRLYGKVRLKDWVAADRERYRRFLEIEEFLSASDLPESTAVASMR